MTDHLDLEAACEVMTDASQRSAIRMYGSLLISEVERLHSLHNETSTSLTASRLECNALREEVERLQADVERKDEALRDVLNVADCKTEDLSTCPYYRGEGTCFGGCTDEPRCQTCEPEGGWPLDRARAALSESPTETKGENG